MWFVSRNLTDKQLAPSLNQATHFLSKNVPRTIQWNRTDQLFLYKNRETNCVEVIPNSDWCKLDFFSAQAIKRGATYLKKIQPGKVKIGVNNLFHL